jgi:hypothetical protein
MPRTRCPACGSIFGEWLEEPSKSGVVDLYRCQTCAYSWNVPKEDPDAPPHVKPLRAKFDSNKPRRSPRSKLQKRIGKRH